MMACNFKNFLKKHVEELGTSFVPSHLMPGKNDHTSFSPKQMQKITNILQNKIPEHFLTEVLKAKYEIESFLLDNHSSPEPLFKNLVFYSPSVFAKIDSMLNSFREKTMLNLINNPTKRPNPSISNVLIDIGKKSHLRRDIDRLNLVKNELSKFFANIDDISPVINPLPVTKNKNEKVSVWTKKGIKLGEKNKSSSTFGHELTHFLNDSSLYLRTASWAMYYSLLKTNFDKVKHRLGKKESLYFREINRSVSENVFGDDSMCNFSYMERVYKNGQNEILSVLSEGFFSNEHLYTLIVRYPKILSIFLYILS